MNEVEPIRAKPHDEHIPALLARLEAPRPEHRLRIVGLEEDVAEHLGQELPGPPICTRQLETRDGLRDL